jgi:hypothetical protein
MIVSQIKRAQLPKLEECCWQGTQFVVTQVQMGQISKAPQLCRNTVKVIVVYLSAITMYIWLITNTIMYLLSLQFNYNSTHLLL